MSKTLFPILAAGVLLVPAYSARADGTEMLGAPSIAIQSGTSIIAAGTGLYSQPGTIDVSVPAGATVKQVLLYWDGGAHADAATDATIQVDGIEVTGTKIGETTGLFNDPADPARGLVRYASYRADITSLALVAPGANELTVSGLNNSFANDGAGLLVIIQEGANLADIGLRDGIDWAYWKDSGNLQVTAPQTFTFAAANVARQASLTLFVGSVDQNRPNEIRITVNGELTTLVNQLFSNAGDQWDSRTIPINIPAGATSLTVELVSTPIDNALGGGASLVWVTAALAIAPAPQPPPPDPDPNPGTRTPGYWKNHPAAWPDSTIQLGGVQFTREEAIGIMNEPTRGDKTLNLAEHLIAAKLNVAMGNDDSCVSQAIAAADAFLAVNAIGSGVSASSAAWKSIEPTFNTLAAYNEGRLCVGHAEGNSDPATPSPSGRGFTKVEKQGKKLLLRWDSGVLEWAEKANGPWTPVPNVTNPADLPTDGKMKFYRLR